MNDVRKVCCRNENECEKLIGLVEDELGDWNEENKELWKKLDEWLKEIEWLREEV